MYLDLQHILSYVIILRATFCCLQHCSYTCIQISLAEIWKCVEFVYTHILIGFSGVLVYSFFYEDMQGRKLFMGKFSALFRMYKFILNS